MNDAYETEPVVYCGDVKKHPNIKGLTRADMDRVTGRNREVAELAMVCHQVARLVEALSERLEAASFGWEES